LSWRDGAIYPTAYRSKEVELKITMHIVYKNKRELLVGAKLDGLG
jgi:hypothetical protein